MSKNHDLENLRFMYKFITIMIIDGGQSTKRDNQDLNSM